MTIHFAKFCQITSLLSVALIDPLTDFKGVSRALAIKVGWCNYNGFYLLFKTISFKECNYTDRRCAVCCVTVTAGSTVTRNE